MITQKRKREELQLLSQEALDAYMNRPDFQYDANGDALYRHYKDQYTELGKRAMQDTMGQAAALTGGYGSSYTQSVGQQAYQSYLSRVDDVIPELYQLAYQKYQDEGNRLYKTYQSWADLEQQAAQQEQWEREYELEERKRQDANRRFQLEQERKNSQTQTSQTQTAAYQPDYWASLAAYHKLGQNNSTAAVDTTAAEPEYDNGKVSEGNVKTMQRILGLQETGKWTDDDRTGAGGLTADKAWEYYQKGQLQNYKSVGLSLPIGYIKTMERVLGLEEDGYWSKEDQKAAGGLTAYAAWKDYQQGKLQSRSRSGMSVDEWADLKKKQSSSSGFNMKETTRAVREFIGQMMTKEQASKRGITSKEWEAMVVDRLNHAKLSAAEFHQLEMYYGLHVTGGGSDVTGTDKNANRKMSYSEYRKNTAAQKVDDLQSEIQRYFRDYQLFVNAAVSSSENVGYQNATSMLESRIQLAADLKKRADILLTSLETSVDIISGEYSELLAQISSMQKDIDSIMDALGGQVKYYSNLPNIVADYYDSEISRVTSEMEELQAQREDYINDTWVDWTDYTSRQKYEQGLNDIEAVIEKIGTQKYQLEEGKQYQIMRFNPDYAELSKQKPTAEYVPNLSSNAALMHIQERNFYDNMTQDQIADYNYLYAKEGKEAADKYVAYISSDVNARIQAELNKIVSAIADKAPITSSLLSTPIKLMGGVGLVDVGLQKLERELTGSYKPIDYNTPSMAFTNAGNAIRDTVSQKITDATGVIDFDEEKHPVLSRVLNGKSLADVYQLGMSMQDSAAIAGLAVINPVLGKVGTVLLSTSSGTDAMLDAVSRGASDEQALTMGILTAGFEMIFEKYELESLLGQGTNVWQACWRQGLSEWAGEGATEISNILADIAVMAEKSQWSQNISRYLENHPDWGYNEAAKQAFIDAAVQVGEASFGGLISGSAMGSGYAANTRVNQAYVAKRLMAKGFNPEKSAKMADAIAARLNGQELTTIQKDRLRSATDSGVVRDVMSDITKKKAAGIDSAQNRIYDREDISDGLTDEEKTALWDLAHQQVGIFSDHDYATATEHSVPHQVRNTFSEGVHGVGTDTVTYRRVQGGGGNNASQARIKVNADGSSSIPNKEANLSISIDGGEHAQYFLNKRGGDAQIIEIDVPKWFDDFLQENAIPQVNYKTNPRNQGGAAPKITDITTPGNCFELPAPWIEWLEEYGRNARIVNP